jgi:hypothetical protein
VLVSGRSLAGVQLGDTMAQVRAHWGGHFARGAGCKPAMWFYTYPPPSDEVSKAAVTSILTRGAAVDGFAPTRPAVSPCLDA